MNPGATALLWWSGVCSTRHLFLIHKKASSMEAAVLSTRPSPGIFAFLRRHLDTRMTRNILMLMAIHALTRDGE